jgi:D-methionine transport system ATP-binding protein
MEPIIRVEHVSKTFHAKNGQVEAVKDISFDIEKGDIFGIIGLSGAGKSTLVRCLNLLEKPSSGKVFVDGKSLTDLSDKELRKARQNIGMIFQHFNLLMQRNVLDNVCFPLEIAGVKRNDAKKRAMELLETVGLSEKAKAYPAQLSGGQKQRVAIARVLANNPQILLCDEATSALDPQTTKSILALLKEINQKYGITIVVITHEMGVIQEICSHVAVLDHGNLEESGTVEELFRSPKTEAAKKLVLTGAAHISRMKGGRKVRVTFDGKSAFEPIIGNIILECKTPVNILYADTKTINGNAEGEMIIQLPDSEEVAEKIVTYFKEKKLGVEEVEEVTDYVG